MTVGVILVKQKPETWSPACTDQHNKNTIICTSSADSNIRGKNCLKTTFCVYNTIQTTIFSTQTAAIWMCVWNHWKWPFNVSVHLFSFPVIIFSEHTFCWEEERLVNWCPSGLGQDAKPQSANKGSSICVCVCVCTLMFMVACCRVESATAKFIHATSHKGWPFNYNYSGLFGELA